MAHFDGYALFAILITFLYLLCCTVCWKYWKNKMPHRHFREERTLSRAGLGRVHIEANYAAGHPNTADHVKYIPQAPPPCYEDINLYTPHNSSLLESVTMVTGYELPSYNDVMTTRHVQTTPSQNMPSG